MFIASTAAVVLGLYCVYLLNLVGRLNEIKEDQDELIEDLIEELASMGSPNVHIFKEKEDRVRGNDITS